MEDRNMQERLRKSLAVIKKLQAELKSKRSEEKVSIIGAAFRMPGVGEDEESLWEGLINKFNAVTRFPNDRLELLGLNEDEVKDVKGGFISSIDQFDPGFFNIGLEEAKAMDPQHRMMLELVWRVFEDANYNIDDFRGKRVGVFIALSNNDYSFQRLRTEQSKSPYDFTGNILAPAAGRISYTFDFRGPAVVIDTACSTALVAMDQAYNSLLEGKCDLAIVGGVNLILDLRVNEVLHQIEALSPDGYCKPLDASANGYTRSEGGAAFLLKRESDLDADKDHPVCEILGSATNHDGKSNGFTAPNGKAQEAVIKEAIRNAGIRTTDIDIIELHGTGTKLGDPIEIEALQNVLFQEQRDNKLLVGSVKSNIGHLECAAGFAGLIKLILSFKHKTFPPTAHIKELNPLINWHNKLDVPTQEVSLEHHKQIIAGISSFGISGTNAHLILGSSAKHQAPAQEDEMQTLLLSAPSQEKLKALIEDYKSYLSHTVFTWEEVCAAAALGRKHWSFRATIEARNNCEALQNINSGSLSFSDNHKKLAKPEQNSSGVHPNSLKIRYLNGEELDYTQLFRPLKRKVKIPGLTFLKRGCWVYKNEVFNNAIRITKNLTHPFLKSYFTIPGDEMGHHFTGKIDLQEHPWLHGHQLFGQVVFPGSGIQELAMFAAKELLETGTPVKELKIISPLYLSGTINLWLQLKKIKEGNYEGSVYSRMEEGDWVLNSTFQLINTPIQEPTSFTFSVGNTLSITKFYASCKSIGIQYDDTFAKLEKVIVQGNKLYGFLGEFPEHGNFLISPDILDNCFQVLGVWLLDQFGPQAFVPAQIGISFIYRKPKSKVKVVVELPEHRGQNSIAVSIRVYDGQGLCALFEDFTVVKVDENSIIKPHYFSELPLHTLSWIRDELPVTSTSSLSLPSFNFKFEDKKLLNRSRNTLQALEVLALDFVADIFIRLGFQEWQGQQVLKSDLIRKLKISSKHEKLFGRLLEMGLEAQWFQKKGRFYEIQTLPDVMVDHSIQKFQDSFPHASMELEVVKSCAQNIPAILLGEKDALEVLFPGGSTKLISEFYDSDPFRIMYNICLESFKEWLNFNSSARTFRILEIGAGTGSTSKHLLPLLTDYDVQYDYTDISPLFLSDAREKFKEYAFVNYKTLNIEEPPQEQGYELNSYDLIIASNVLHATKDLNNTFEKVLNLMKPGGALFMLEGIKAMKWIDLIFGLTSGWWLFEDRHLRKSHATLNINDWRHFLSNSGFDHIQFLEPSYKEVSSSGQAVIWAQKIVVQDVKRASVQWVSNESISKGLSDLKEDAFAIAIESNQEALVDVDAHVDVLVQLIDKLKYLDQLDPQNKNLFLFYTIKNSQQIIGFWRVLQNEWLEWNINLVITDDLDDAIVQNEIAHAQKGECSKYKDGQRKILRLVTERLNLGTPLDFNNKKVIITGASGGLARILIKWLLEKGVRKILGVSRSIRSDLIKDIRVTYEKSDVLDWRTDEDLEDYFAIFHLAGSISNQMVLNQDKNTLSSVLKPKIEGAMKMRDIALQNQIPHVFHFSSSAAWLGTSGQSNHAYANYHMTGINKIEQLNEISILWGAWNGAGAIKNYQAESWVHRIGMKTINPEEGLKTLDKILASSHEEIGVFEIDWGKYQTVMQRTPFIQDLVNGQLQSQTHTSEVSPASFTSIEEVIDWLELQLSLTLGYQQKQVFDTDSGFFDLGLDSLTALDFKKNIEREAAVNLPSTLVFKYPTINQLAIFLYAEKQALSSDKQSHSKHESGAVEFIDEEFNSMMDEI